MARKPFVIPGRQRQQPQQSASWGFQRLSNEQRETYASLSQRDKADFERWAEELRTANTPVMLRDTGKEIKAAEGELSGVVIDLLTRVYVVRGQELRKA